jgi:hypothetical protein
MTIFEYLRCWPSDIPLQPLGNLQELRFDSTGQTTRLRGGLFTTQDYIREFPVSSIAYAGLTLRGDDEIKSLGIINLAHANVPSRLDLVDEKLGLSNLEE